MFKKYIGILTMLAVMVMSSIGVEATSSSIDKTKLDSGVIKIDYQSEKRVAVRVQKGTEKKDHILGANNSFPLQFGEGEYTITVLENVEENKFKAVESTRVNFKKEDKNKMYLQSIQGINWNEDMLAIKKAEELTKGAKTDKEKITRIHDYITSNIKYDNHKAENVKPGYLPSIDLTLKEEEGICYDYSSLFAGMARSLNIPTKLVEGRKNDIEDLHAWNKVYLKETNEWIIVDTTYDAAYKQKNIPISMIKNPNEYKVQREY